MIKAILIIFGVLLLLIIGIVEFRDNPENNIQEFKQIESNQNNLADTVTKVYKMENLPEYSTDPFDVKYLNYDESSRILTATINYFGKCTTHEFDLYVSNVNSTYLIVHSSNGDTCTNEIEERVSFVIPEDISFVNNVEGGTVVEQSFDS